MLALITRPIDDAGALAAALAARGVDSLVEPLLAIRLLAGAPPDLAGVQAVLATSANGARAFAAASPRRDLPVFAVGDASAAAARRAGFAQVASAAGDVAALAALVAATLDPGRGALLHAAGTALAGDLAGRLAASGFAVRRAVLYAADPARRLGRSALALRQGAVGAAFFFSPRTAARFVSLAREAGLAETCRPVAAFCLGPAVAAAAAPLPWGALVAADAPNQAALLAAFDRFRGAPPSHPASGQDAR